MMCIVYLLLMRVFHTDSAPCRACVFFPWLGLVLVVVFSMRRAEIVCMDLLRLGAHVTVLAMMYPYSAPHAFACSLNALLCCSWALCRDDVSSCIVCVFTVSALSAMAHGCPYAVQPEAQLEALCVSQAVEFVCEMVSRVWE